MDDLEMLKLENEMLKNTIEQWKQIAATQDFVIQQWRNLYAEMKQEATCQTSIK